MVNVSDEQPVTTSYQWYKGNDGKSYGGFVKEIGLGDKKGLKGFILPKATKLFFEEKKEPEDADVALNSENKNRIPGNLVLVGNGQKLYFFESSDSGDEKLLSRFDLCEDR